MTNKQKFWELTKPSLIIGTIAATLFIVDSLISNAMDLGRGFMWIAFAAWTITFPMDTAAKRKFMIGIPIGFILAVCMYYFGMIFGLEIIGIAIATTIGIFIFNAVAMYFETLKKYLSVTGIFFGIFLPFSGLGIGMSPDTWGNAFTILGITTLYGLLGAICAFLSVYFMNKWKKNTSPKQQADQIPA